MSSLLGDEIISMLPGNEMDSLLGDEIISMLPGNEMDSLLYEMRSSIDMELWYACAGTNVLVPAKHSTAYYFPQGHQENSCKALIANAFPEMPVKIPCIVSGITYMADPDTQEVFVKMSLLPLQWDNQLPPMPATNQDRSNTDFFWKSLTPTDCSGRRKRLIIPKSFADIVFPKMDTSAGLSEQILTAKDIFGRKWTFHHQFISSQDRHYLTGGWTYFIEQKKLVVGDHILFLKGGTGELLVGIKRANRRQGAVCRKRRSEWAIEAACLASKAEPFQVLYFPQAKTPEFLVTASTVDESTRFQWSPGTKVTIPVGRTHGHGTVKSYRPIDPRRWPKSPWRALEVEWRFPCSDKKMNHVNPWVVSLVPES